MAAAALKVEIDQWQDAVVAYENDNFEESLRLFKGLSESAKVHFNIGLMHSAMGNFQDAFESYEAALSLDNYMSIGHFQKGNAKFALEKYEDAIADFDKAFNYLRGNLKIDYKQLGMEHTLYSCEITYNRALCHIRLENKASFKEDIMYAMVNKQTDEHNSCIPKAVKAEGKDCTPFILPKTAIFKPAESKSKNTKKVDYLGKSKVIGSTSETDDFTGFAGKQVKEEEETKKEVEEEKARLAEEEDARREALKKELKEKKAREKQEKKEGKKNKRDSKKVDGEESESDDDRKEKKEKKKKDKESKKNKLLGASSDDFDEVDVTPDLVISRKLGLDLKVVLAAKSKKKDALPEGTLKVKVHYHEICAMLVRSDIKFEALLKRVRRKYNNDNLCLRYKDEDQELILMTEQEDLDLARGYVGNQNQPLSDRVEIYASDQYYLP